MKFLNSKIWVAIYNSFTNIVLISISVFKLTCLLNILKNLPKYTVISGTFRFLGVSVSSFCPYQIILKGASFTSSNHGRILPERVLFFSFGVRSVCVPHLKLSENPLATDVRLSASRSSTRGLLSLLSNVSLDTALALRIYSLTSFCL